MNPFERAPRIAEAEAQALELVRQIRGVIWSKEPDPNEVFGDARPEIDLLTAATLLKAATKWRDKALEDLWLKTETLLATPMYHDHSTAELAGLTVPTVRKRHQRLIHRLREEGTLVWDEDEGWTWPQGNPAA